MKMKMIWRWSEDAVQSGKLWLLIYLLSFHYFDTIFRYIGIVSLVWHYISIYWDRFTSLTLYFDILGSFDTIFRYMGSDRLRSNLTLDFDIRGVIGCVVIWRIVTQLRWSSYHRNSMCHRLEMFVLLSGNHGGIRNRLDLGLTIDNC